MRLNLGCSFDQREGFINIDSWGGCKPDLLLNLESIPWPFADHSVTEIVARHVIEHLAPDFNSFSTLWKEIYRVCSDGCELHIAVPYYKLNEYWSDPSHVRVYTPLTFAMFSKAENKRWQEEASSNTMLAMQLDIDFQVVRSEVIWQPHWQSRLDRGELTPDQLLEIERDRWNVVKELNFHLVAVKP